MCLYDLQKAYDTVECDVLLNRLFEVGVNKRENVEGVEKLV